MKKEYIEKIYAGWLAKIIGIRLGAPIEGWTYEKIRNIYGQLDGYPVNYRQFAADDDSNGPLFFLRALEDGRHGYDVKSQDVAEALLNYAPFEHGFFWWGGYGISTEHTAYLNLRNGIPAPMSGSIEQNGHAAAEQIGGQIFIDTWGLVSPGNPDQAARFAREAAGVTHGGNGVYGGIFVAVCISYAFEETDIRKIIEKGLSYIPEDSEYARAVRSVMAFYERQKSAGLSAEGGQTFPAGKAFCEGQNSAGLSAEGEPRPEDWRACFRYIFENFGYDRYPGSCHIIPNIAVMILALLYGGGDFARTLNICNMCGWDTDCNVGNVATIMGVRNGLAGIDYDKFRRPVNDFLACSSVIGSLNMMDIPYGAVYIAKLAYAAAGEEMPEPWRTIARERIDSCHFEFPGSTHAMRVRVEDPDAGELVGRETLVWNTDESACTGTRALKFLAKPVEPGEMVYVYKKTYYRPSDFDDSRYDPAFSPLIYPGQTLHGSAFLPVYGQEAQVSLYVKDLRGGKVWESEKVTLKKGEWQTLSFGIPAMEGALLGEAGFCFRVLGKTLETYDFTGLVDDLYADGAPDYVLDFAREEEEVWNGVHREISQLTRLKGLMYLDGGSLHLSCADFAEAYTGRYDWKDYRAEFSLTPLTGAHHMVNVRVQGAIRSYAAGLLPGGRIAILKNDNGYHVLSETPFAWEHGKEYEIAVTAQGRRIALEIKREGSWKEMLAVTEKERPYLQGSVGLSVQRGSHCSFRRISVKGLQR